MPINYAQAIDELADEVSTVAESKGFWDEGTGVSEVAAKLALVHSEVSEALEVHRKQYTDGEEDPSAHMTSMQENDFTEELADIVIRVFDIAGELSLDIGDSIVNKVETNKTRPPKHGKRY